jgi:hypothetical protein
MSLIETERVQVTASESKSDQVDQASPRETKSDHVSAPFPPSHPIQLELVICLYKVQVLVRIYEDPAAGALTTIAVLGYHKRNPKSWGSF